jgi:hypothetical protein
MQFGRRSLILVPAFLFLLPALAWAQCELQVTISCSNAFDSSNGARCAAVTTNVGTAACTGRLFTGFAIVVPANTVTLSNTTNTAGFTDCQIYPPDAKDPATYSICAGSGSLNPASSYTSIVDLHLNGSLIQPLTVAAGTGAYDPITQRDQSVAEAQTDIEVPTCTPRLSVPSNVTSGSGYTVSWTAVTSNTTYEVQESLTADFANSATFGLSGLSKDFTHTVTTPTTFYYRVRAISCGGTAGVYSATSAVVVSPVTTTPSGGSADVPVPLGSTDLVTFQIFVPGVPTAGKTGVQDDATTYAATTDKPWLTVTPPSGTVPPQGTTLTATGNPAGLPVGATTGTVTVTTNTNMPPVSTPVSISLVTPVSAVGKGVPPASSLIIPGVAHLDGSARFQSDVRLTNANNAATTYQLQYTPANSDGTVAGKATKVTIDPQQTVALNDVVRDFFGVGAGTDSGGLGVLQIRALGSSSPLSFSSSRTYANTAAGTYGQYIPAIPFSSFVAQSLGTKLFTLSLQQVAESDRFRTNLGLVEGSGAPASGRIRIFNDGGTLLKEVPFSLRAGEYVQYNQFLKSQNIALEDGRIEIIVDSTTGAVTAYASVLDNKTQDPLLVEPMHLADANASRYVLPGMADLNNGAANFHSDIRLFNSGTEAVNATLTFYPINNPAASKSVARFLGAGQVLAVDNALPSLFGVTADAGSILVSTGMDSSLVVTGRTYSNAATGGTFGQFIPAVSPDDARGAGQTPLQLLQLEESAQFRSNIGIAEVTGNAATVKVSAFLPDSKVTPSVTFDVKANEFRQLNSFLRSLIPANTYNARVSVQVTGGSGKITAYGSVIDNRTQDPTYIPAQ